MTNSTNDLNNTQTVNPGMLKLIGIVIALVCVFTLGFVSGRVIQDYSSRGTGSIFQAGSGNNNSSGISVGNNSNNSQNANFTLFWNVWNTLKDRYVDENKVSEENMFYGSIKGMVSSYDDPATVFLDPKETENFNKGNEGKLFEGIGAELGYKDGVIVVISPLDGSPANKAGVRPGDIILKVDGQDIKPADNVFDVASKIRGKSGTEVTLTVLHPGDSETVEIKITRGEITVPSMSFKKTSTDGIVVFDIARFTDASPSDWNNNWDMLVKQANDSGAKGIILDLRGNPGGFFDAAVYAASDFLPKGTVIAKQQDRQGGIKESKVERNGRLVNIPVVVLVNEGSASASEILAGALQKNNRAKVIGVKSYGKGTAQSVINFSDGSSLHITIWKWLLPDGTWINHDNPIAPDTEVKLSDEDFKKGLDTQMEEAVKQLEAKM